jgi:hypothetical protein
MTKTNNLNSHCGESSNSRADKMSGHGKGWNVGYSKKDIKKFYSKKRRQFLNNEKFFDKM